MSAGKYSPTVSAAYRKDQNWWKKNVDTSGNYDIEGYDSYGYSKDNGPDRAGYTEDDYLRCGKCVDGNYQYRLLDQVYDQWTVNQQTGLPARL